MTGTMPYTPSVFCAVSAVIAVAAKASSIVTALMSAWMPAPPPLSEPATIRTRPRNSAKAAFRDRGLDPKRLFCLVNIVDPERRNAGSRPRQSHRQRPSQPIARR